MIHRIRQFVSATVISGLLLVVTGSVLADDYKLDPSHTAVVFKIKHIKFSDTYGRFNDVRGQFSGGAQPSFNFTVKTKSVDTNFPKRDDHLRGPDFFNTQLFPEITFKSTAVESHGHDLHVTGDMTLHGVTNSVTIELHKMGEGQDPWGAYRCGYSTVFTIKRSDFDMAKMLDLVGDEVTLMVSFEGIRQ